MKFNRSHNQRVAQIVKEEHLIEMTPEEVAEHRVAAFATLRQKLAERGYVVQDDEALWRLLKDAMATRGGPGGEGATNG